MSFVDWYTINGNIRFYKTKHVCSYRSSCLGAFLLQPMPNAQIVSPAAATVVKPNELESTLARPIHVSVYVLYLATTLSYGIIEVVFFLYI